MVFYLLITALFLGGVHGRSSRYALTFAVAAVALGRLFHPGTLSHHLLTPGIVVAITDSLVLVGLVLVLAGRGRTRTGGAALAAATGLLVIILNGGYAASWETYVIFALMFTGTLLYRAEAGEYPWRRALYVAVLVFGFALVAALLHTSPLAGNPVAIRKTFNSLEFAGLTFAAAMLCRNRTVPRPLAWLGLVSYSVYLLHPALIEIYSSVPWTRHQKSVLTELFLVVVFVSVLLVCCGLTHRFIEVPMQRLGRRLAARLDVRFGPDTLRPRRAGLAPAAVGDAQYSGTRQG
jgi:peptidoglycan/LPS O-acetylase OafA/YrhL